ncbi:MAG: hypothetical protein R3208_09255 [Ketobacteraceae bacterium]|nr:hypothetical protein [Ketobacteraceae bacterium]
MNITLLKRWLITLISATLLALGGCAQDTGEEVGEDIDEAIEDTKEAVDNACDEVTDSNCQ